MNQQADQEGGEQSPAQWQALLEPGAVLLDLKGIVPRQLQPMRL